MNLEIYTNGFLMVCGISRAVCIYMGFFFPSEVFSPEVVHL